MDVNEGAAGVAGVDCRIGLDEVFVIEAHGGSADGADHAHGGGFADAEGVADGQHDVADFDALAVGKGDGRQAAGIHLEHGEVGLWVIAQHLGSEGASVVKCHLHLVGVLDHVMIGEDVAVRGDDHAAGGAVFAGLGQLAVAAVALIKQASGVETAERLGRQQLSGIAKGERRLGFGQDVDLHHRRGDPLEDLGETCRHPAVAINGLGVDGDVRRGGGMVALGVDRVNGGEGDAAVGNDEQG